ncbi:hypothetical protein CVT25_015266 [Psilocybe cyanescens]|uniref:Thioredoxin domain-containing protein n=1 Tax=Psilocybe cyanescens TaxID=93625 RepID=A0A409XRC0_PSICY|nr:hypothetical protein CVT25_015266 [Psilocybe cyanescens]
MSSMSMQSCLSSGIRTFHLSSPRAVLYPKASQSTFEKAIKAKNRIAVVDFYADWCGPCHQLAPVLERFTSEPHTSGSGLPLDLVKIDTSSDDGQLLGALYKVRALPTVIAFRNGSPITHFVGTKNEAGVQEFLNKL